jgi:hypothetical protein
MLFEKLVLEAEHSCGINRKNFRIEIHYQATASENCKRLRRPSIIVNCECVKQLQQNSVSPITNLNSVCGH